MTDALATETMKQKAALVVDTIYRIRTAQAESGKRNGHFLCPQCQKQQFFWAVAADNSYRGSCRDGSCFAFSGH